MTPARARAAALVLVPAFLAVVLLALLTVSCTTDRSSDVRTRFVDLFPAAEKRSSYLSQHAFSVSEVALGGLTRRAVLARAPSRLMWAVDVPPGASLSGSIGLRPEAWYGAGDGVVFKIAVSIGTEYAELYSLRVHPRRRRSDRRWVPFEISLAQYAGQHANLVFETDSSPSDGPVDARKRLRSDALYGFARMGDAGADVGYTASRAIAVDGRGAQSQIRTITVRIRE